MTNKIRYFTKTLPLNTDKWSYKKDKKVYLDLRWIKTREKVKRTDQFKVCFSNGELNPDKCRCVLLVTNFIVILFS
jgi:hypothetical protein